MVIQIIMMAYGIADGQSFFTQWRDLLWISVFGVMNLYAAGEIKLLYNLRKIPVDKLMDAQKQMLDVDAYRSEKYKIYVINEDECLSCGTCSGVCPVDAPCEV